MNVGNYQHLPRVSTASGVLVLFCWARPFVHITAVCIVDRGRANNCDAASRMGGWE